MEIVKTKKWFYYLISIAVALVLVLGVWWLSLVVRMANSVATLNIPHIIPENLTYMIKWEGITFITLLILIALGMFWVYFQDLRKTHALQAFFSSLTHELKTPLASVKLQTQVLESLFSTVEIDSEKKEKIEKYIKRLIEDSNRLENELDKSLQLSRVEQGGTLNLIEINLQNFIQNIIKSYEPLMNIKINKVGTDHKILADEFALSMIFRNLLDNTLRHNKNTNKDVEITLTQVDVGVQVSYNDHGEKFNGDINKLGTLFYKYDSSKGSGIGLYLIKKLIKKMNGRLEIFNTPNLIMNLNFKK